MDGSRSMSSRTKLCLQRQFGDAAQSWLAFKLVFDLSQSMGSTRVTVFDEENNTDGDSSLLLSGNNKLYRCISPSMEAWGLEVMLLK